MPVSGPDFISLQVRDLEASAAFYAKYLGLTRQDGPPHAVVFDTAPTTLAVRERVPGNNLDAGSLGAGIGLWLHAPDAQQIHDAMLADGVTIASDPIDGPFGRTFTFVDPDGYQLTLHSRA